MAHGTNEFAATISWLGTGCGIVTSKVRVLVYCTWPNRHPLLYVISIALLPTGPRPLSGISFRCRRLCDRSAIPAPPPTFPRGVLGSPSMPDARPAPVTTTRWASVVASFLVRMTYGLRLYSGKPCVRSRIEDQSRFICVERAFAAVGVSIIMDSREHAACLAHAASVYCTVLS